MNIKKINQTQRSLNEHSNSVVNIFNVGRNQGQHKWAFRNAMVHIVPVLSNASKDQKISKGKMKMWAMVNVMDGHKQTFSDRFSDALSGFVTTENDGILCSSTEELLKSFESFNKK